MTNNQIQLQRERARWYPLIPHPVQLALVNAVRNGTRFPVVPAGRRSGKTERAKRFLVKQAMQTPGLYFAGAPTYGQAKKIWWTDLKLLSFSSTHLKKPSEGELRLFLPNGSEIHVLGLDQPSRIEGIPWKGGILDEFADIKESAWNLNILPALNTVDPREPDYRAWCWLTGVPEGLGHYYDLARYAEAGNDPDFGLFHWKSAEILPPDVIDAAKRTMSAKEFRQEYEATFEGTTGRIYEDYGAANHTTEGFLPHETLHWSHDQNFTPLSSCISVVRGDAMYILDEIVLTSAVSKQSAQEFVDKYKNHKNKHVYLYGDPAGRAGEKHGHASDYDQIEQVLEKHGWKVSRRVAMSHPAIKDRQNAVRAKILAADGTVSLFVNPATAPWCNKGLATVQVMEGSTYQEDQRNKYQHITTAIGYQVAQLWARVHDRAEMMNQKLTYEDTAYA